MCSDCRGMVRDSHRWAVIVVRWLAIVVGTSSDKRGPVGDWSLVWKTRRHPSHGHHQGVANLVKTSYQLPGWGIYRPPGRKISDRFQLSKKTVSITTEFYYFILFHINNSHVYQIIAYLICLFKVWK